MLSPQDFSSRIKQKYPQYAEIDDMELTSRILEKHPQYRDRVQLEGDLTIPSEASISPQEPIIEGESTLELGKAGKRAVEQVGEIKDAVGSAISIGADTTVQAQQFAQELSSLPEEEYDQVILGALQGSRKRGAIARKQIIGAIKSSPAVLGNIVSSVAETFGFDTDAILSNITTPLLDEERNFIPRKEIHSKERAFEKIESDPIGSIMDLFVVKSLASGVVKGTYKGLSSASKRTAQKQLKKTLSGLDPYNKELMKSLSDDVLTPESKLLKHHAEGISKVGRKKLNNPEYIKQTAENAQNRLNALAKVEKGALSKEVSKMPNVGVNKSQIIDDIFRELEDVDLFRMERYQAAINAGKTPKQALNASLTEEVLKTGRFSNLMDDLFDPSKELTPKVINKKLKIIGKSRYSDLNVEDAMKASSRAYRNRLIELSPEHAGTRGQVAQKLSKFGDDLAKFKKTGSHEKLGKSILSSEAERREFIELLKQNKFNVGKRAAAQLQLFDDAAAWNIFWDQNQETFTRAVFRIGPFRESIPANKIITHFQQKSIVKKASKQSQMPKTLRQRVLRSKALKAKLIQESQQQIQGEQ